MLFDLTMWDSNSEKNLLWYSPDSFIEIQFFSSWAVIYAFFIFGETLFLTPEVGLELWVGIDKDELGI
jgi:hypothetical protein